MDNSPNGMELLQRTYVNMAEQIRQLIAPSADHLNVVSELARSIQENLHPIVEMNKVIEKSTGSLVEQMASVGEDIARCLEALPARNREALCLLGQHGWYPDPELPFTMLFGIAGELKSGNQEHAYSLLCDYFEARFEEIEAALKNAAPNRARFIASALSAHRRGEYVLSIPVLLAQADGICQDITGIQLYSKKNNGLRPVLDSEPFSAFRESVFAPLLEPMPLTAAKHERVPASGILNRHAIIHGESVDYDTYVNSCRAISLLLFITWVLDGTKKVSVTSRISASTNATHKESARV